MASSISRENNFDVIRLAAALQVAVNHTLTHLQVAQNGILFGGGRNLDSRFQV